MNVTAKDCGIWFSKTLLTMSLAGLTACAPATLEKLPDDPTDEVVLPGDPSPSISDLSPAPEEFTPEVTEGVREQVLGKYGHLDPNRIVPTKLLEAAVVYFDANQSKIANKKYLSVIDFAQRSNKRRFYIVDMSSGAVWTTTVAHGKGSDANHDGFAEKFSNVSGSKASSLGYYLTAETYNGSNGYSLRLDGLSSTNSRARSRAIVIHGASYVQDRDVIQGRSWGCPAVPLAYRDKVISWLKGGSLIYAGKSF